MDALPIIVDAIQSLVSYSSMDCSWEEQRQRILEFREPKNQKHQEYEKLLEALLENSQRLVACGGDLLVLSKKIQELLDQMNSYQLLSALISQPLKHVQMIIENPSLETFDMNSTPLSCALNLISLLEQENPLKQAMEADPLRTRATFYKWTDSFNGILAKLLVLECIVNGIFFNKDMTGPKQLSVAIVKFQGLIHKWENEYKSDKDGYWLGLQRLVVKAQNENEHLGNEEKAEILKSELGRILTKDVFYIIVYDQCDKSKEVSLHASIDKFFDSCCVKGCCVVIYRSFELNPMSYESVMGMSDLEHRGQMLKRPDIGSTSLRTSFRTFRDGNVGFCGILHEDNHAVVKHVNSWNERGPGTWVRASGELNRYTLVVGYK